MAGAENDFKELHDAIKDGKAGENEFREELLAEVHKREVLEADFIKINA